MGSKGIQGAAPLIAIVAVAIVALSVLWMAGEFHFRSCLQEAETRYPGIPVSAYVSKVTGPLKVAYNAERAKAVGDCGRLPF